MKRPLPNPTFYTVVFLFLSLFFANLLFAQTTSGDYRSVGAGNWTTLSSWQYYNGTAWVTPSGISPQGYPGQFAGAGTVTIRNGNSITLNANITNRFTALIIGESLTATTTFFGNFSIGGDFQLNTLDVVISKYGLLQFTDNKGSLYLPASTGILIDPLGGLAKVGGPGNCNNNVNIFIGEVEYGVCTGNGALFTFEEVNNSGGTLYAIPTSNSPVCKNNTINLLGSYSGKSGNTTSVGSTLGVNYSWSIKDPNNVITTSSAQNPNFTASLSGNYSVTLTCATYFGNALFTNSKTITVVVNPVPATPKFETKTQLTCTIPSGSVVLSGLPSSGTLKQTGYITKSYPITATTMTISDLVAGDYYFAVNNGTCESVISPVVTIVDKSSTTWNGSGWLNGEPSITSRIIFAGNYNSTKDVIGCDCTVNSGASVVFKYINPTLGHTLTVTNDVKVLGSGKLTFENNASLVQTANSITNTNSGKITYQRQASPYKPFDYIYWSSPVLGQKLRDVSPQTPLDKFYSFDVASYDWKQEDPNLPMMNGVGYIIRGADYVSPTPPGLHQASFFGVPNNGLITVPIPATPANSESSALLGNPYPSALDANEFLRGNSSILEGTLYFWTHNTAIQDVGNITNGSQGSGALAYTSDDYATYNLTGGVTVVSTTNIVTDHTKAGSKPSGKIASGQSFFAGINSVAGTVKFENSMRVGVGTLTGDNSQFFRTASSKSDVTNAYENHRVWLNLTNSQGAFKQLLVGYITGATNAYDPFFDGVSFNGNEFVDFYSITDDETLTIQGRALPFEENDVVPLGYSSAIEGSFTISIDEVDGLFTSQNIYLEDKLNSSIHDLKKSGYTFQTSTGTFDDRFVLRYADKTLSVGDFDDTSMQVLVSIKNKQIKINSAVESIDKVLIYDVLGKQIYANKNVDATELVIPNLGSSEQVLIVKTQLQNGQTVTTKLIY
ncbi:T9SS sorting signal type C domain-containing protein [Flavobacterium sandaracinum]|uniref:T9SS sorting signal type C domain-containing protein n=1 Tax=Flavobacterium sandaracinum TaxID=2541733 RepID=A0A4V2Z218_9FLAO|nr:T9SS sorting signal type C domain-containing protein [Flavobacterium sandaracinum]TDE05968.1 T9SS sorting signal type C domain-containing protein [Flavobacterium sandaracinum]